VAPDRARFVAELARIIHGSGVRAAERAGAPLEPPGTPLRAETVPIPMSAAWWSRRVFGRPTPPDQIVATILSDARASYLCYGLAGLDDETLRFVAGQPALVTRLYSQDAPLFAAFGSVLRIRGGRVQAPGGRDAEPLWEAAVGQPLGRPAAFIPALLTAQRGRLAYLYQIVSLVDAPRARFALGLWRPDPDARIREFNALVTTVAAAFPQWDPARFPFARPLDDIASLLVRIRASEDGSPRTRFSKAAWAWAFAGGELPETGARVPGRTAADPPDAAWLAQAILLNDAAGRRERLDQLSLGQRLFADVDPRAAPDALAAVRALPRFPMLMLGLERVGIRSPAVFAAAARAAQQIEHLEGRHAVIAHGAFQGALALVARLAAARSIEAAAAERLVASLATVRFTGGRPAAGIARWIDQELQPVLAAVHRRAGAGAPDAADVDALLLDALAGGSAPGPAVAWEGHEYRLDIAASERRRLERVRRRQGGPSLAAALVAARAGSTGDEAVARALVAWAYAVAIPWADSPALGGSAASRHDFGLDRPGPRDAAWALPRQQVAIGVPWHVKGSLLGLELAFAPLGLRRIADRPIDAPALSSNERDTFALSVALLNPYELRDADRDRLAAFIERGRDRVAALAEDADGVDELAAELRLDGWRARALRWALARDPADALALFSLTELLALGGGELSRFDAWGMPALGADGCLCPRLLPAWMQALAAGRPQVGLLAEHAADLHLHVALALAELGLPAAAAKSVLAAATQDFIDEVRPTDFGDWLTLVRAGREATRERIEDYAAVATADGPLVRMP